MPRVTKRVTKPSDSALKHVVETADGFQLFLLHDVGIDLRAADVAVAQQSAYGVEVAAQCDLQGGEGVAGAVEGEVFGNAGVPGHAF